MTIKSVHVVTGGSIDSLDYESGISDAAYKNLGKVLPVDERLQTPEGINLIGPIWKQDTRFTLCLTGAFQLKRNSCQMNTS